MSAKTLRIKEQLWGYFFILPTLIFFITFVLLPMVNAIRFSLTDSNFATADFIDLKNYSELIKDSVFIKSFINTFIFVLYLVPATIIFSLFFSVLLLRVQTSIQSIFRTIFYIPIVISVVPLCLVWTWIYNPTFGFANYFLSILRLPSLNWLGNANYTILSISVIYFMFTLGQPLVLYMAGIAGIPKTLYEAAELDGANEWQKFWKITFFFGDANQSLCFYYDYNKCFPVFHSCSAYDRGGPNYASSTVLFLIYKYAFDFTEFGKACAMSVILCIVIAIISAVQFRIMSGTEEY